MAGDPKNRFFHWSYGHILKPIFFTQDPEYVHNRMVRVGGMLGKYKLTQKITSSLFSFSHPFLEQKILGLDFKNPIGLAAGFDKNAELTDILPSVGFGFVEVGSITGLPCAGNDKPRLWRLKRSRGLLVNFGLKSDGAEVLAKRLEGRTFRNIVGTSIAMTNNRENLEIENAIMDYAKAFQMFTKIGDYFTINISCPNTLGGQPFIEPSALEMLLAAIDKIETRKPIFVKLSPDLNNNQVDEILNILSGHRVHGIICSNLTKSRSNSKIFDENLPPKGGISGKPVQDLADQLLSTVYQKTKGKYILVGCGGVFNAQDAYKKIRLGASLIQLATGMIYEGPQLIGQINRDLVDILKKDGFKSISEAIGIGLG